MGHDLSAISEERATLPSELADLTEVVAHDLQQPVAVIELLAGILAQRSGSSWETTLLARACARLRRLVADLGDASAIEAGRLCVWREPLDLAALIKSCVDTWSHTHPSVPLRLRPSSVPGVVHADAVRIEQVMENLLSNATKYGAAAAGIDVTLEASDGEVVVAVSNRGDGIPAAELPLVFERHRRTAAARGSHVRGQGLGLFIVRGLVRAHGGRVSVESTVGETTTVRFTIPYTVSNP